MSEENELPKINTFPLSELQRAETGDWLEWDLTKSDFANVIANNMAHCLGANSVRRELKLPDGSYIRFKYGDLFFRYNSHNYKLQLDEKTQDVAVNLDRLSESGGDWQKLIQPQKMRARFLSIRESEALSRSRLDQMQERNKLTNGTFSQTITGELGGNAGSGQPQEKERLRAFAPRQGRSRKDYYRYKARKGN